MSNEINTQVLVIGSGPAGYSAAFRSADLGKEVLLVEKYESLGGVCLNVGCIPSKALLHIAKVLEDSSKINEHGISFSEPIIDIEKIAQYKNNITSKLSKGIASMAKQRKVKILNGYAKFLDDKRVQLDDENKTIITFEDAIIAAGSRPIKLPFIPHDDSRIWDSTDALNIKTPPKKLLVMGGGIIGLEMGTVYEKLGSSVDVIEMFEQLIPAADKDVIKTYTKANAKRFNIKLKTKVVKVEAKEDAIYVSTEDEKQQIEVVAYDAVLVAIGRVPNGLLLDAQNAGIYVDERGFIQVNSQMQTNVNNIYAVGDIVGQPMLAHKGVHEAHTAAEVIAGKNHFFEPKVIPSIAYTFPEVAWVGLTQKEAEEQDINYEVAVFPWQASGRAMASDISDGMTKLIFNKDSNQLIGGALVGEGAGELLGEITLALEMDCNAEDLAQTIHAHPTLYESVGMAAEIYECTITDLPNSKLRRLESLAKRTKK
jgi:dihydrolipoamide dehydrogenase